MEASIFFRNLTCLDHAYIDDKGMVRGCSYHVSANVSGKVTGNEHVVLDFSAGKKLIKAAIDDKQFGYDHKLIIYPNSNVKVTLSGIPGIMRVQTPFLDAHVPHDTIRVVSYSTLQNELDVYFRTVLPDMNVEFSLDQKGFSTSPVYFNYVHGLKQSSSWGCQNIHHGHTSFIEVYDRIDGRLNNVIGRVIAGIFHDKILVFRDNVVDITEDSVSIAVNTNLRGWMKATYKSHNIMIMETETTIEYMANYIATNLKETLEGYNVNISEGLQKGCHIVC